MKASVGDRIVVVSNRTEHPPRDGRILEVRNPDGSPPYLIEWSDTGHRGLVYPGSDAYVQHFQQNGSAAEPPEPQRPGEVRTWRVELTMFELDGETTAHAMLVGDLPETEAIGSARRRPGAGDVPEIGDEIAAARALRRLADRLLGEASDEVSALEGQLVQIRP